MTAAQSQPLSALHVQPIDAAVRAIGLDKVIDERIVLQSLNFNVDPGEFVAILGANGAGKSTLLKILATLTAPTRGELFLLGRRCTTDAAALRSRIGLISHGSMLYRDLSALENLVFFGRIYGVNDSKGRANHLLEWLGLASRAHDPVKTFSRGMTQRVAIARALMHKPDLLLADEPFAGLDAPSCHMVQQMLHDLHKQGHTIVLTNHDIHQSLGLVRRVLVLQHGRMVVDQPATACDARSLLKEVSGP